MGALGHDLSELLAQAIAQLALAIGPNVGAQTLAQLLDGIHSQATRELFVEFRLDAFLERYDFHRELGGLAGQFGVVEVGGIGDIEAALFVQRGAYELFVDAGNETALAQREGAQAGRFFTARLVIDKYLEIDR